MLFDHACQKPDDIRGYRISAEQPSARIDWLTRCPASVGPSTSFNRFAYCVGDLQWTGHLPPVHSSGDPAYQFGSIEVGRVARAGVCDFPLNNGATPLCRVNANTAKS